MFKCYSKVSMCLFSPFLNQTKEKRVSRKLLIVKVVNQTVIVNWLLSVYDLPALTAQIHLFFWMIQKQIIEKKNSVQLFVLFGLILKIRSVFISEEGKGWIPFLLINIWYWWLVFMNKNLKDLSLNSNTCLQSILGRCSITNLCMFIEI